MPKEWAGEETVIAESADVDRETAAALREKRMPKPPDAWFRRVAAMQLRSPTAADVQYCRAVFELRAAAVIELLAYRREAGDVSRIAHNSYHSVQLAAYARCLVTAEISSRLPAWPLALPVDAGLGVLCAHACLADRRLLPRRGAARDPLHAAHAARD